MALLHQAVSAPLRPFVALLWLQTRSVADAAPSHAFERLMPSGGAELIFHLELPYIRIYETDTLSPRDLPPALLSGPHTRPFLIDAAPEEVLGAHFHPGGLYPFFGNAVEDLANQSVALRDLWGDEAVFLHERILAAPSTTARFRVLESALHRRLRYNSPCAGTVAWMRGELARGRSSVADLVAAIGFSHRYALQQFRAETGLTPSAFARIRRFERVLGAVHPLPKVDWAEQAALAGYYDQAHFIHDFAHFSGLTPTQYWKARTRHVLHVAA